MAGITALNILEALKYDPESGIFSWLSAPSRNIKAGSVAGSSHRLGYLRIVLHGKEYMAHRLAWYFTYGCWPDGCIDHIDGVRINNSINNLRDVSVSVNQQNLKGATKRNSVGLLGVTKRTKNCYRAQINIDGKDISIGHFKSAEAAHAAYIEVKRRHHAGNTL